MGTRPGKVNAWEPGRRRVWQTTVAPEITGIRERERSNLVFAVERDKTVKVGEERLTSACKHVVKRDTLVIHSDATDSEVTLLAGPLSTLELWIEGQGEILWRPPRFATRAHVFPPQRLIF